MSIKADITAPRRDIRPAQDPLQAVATAHGQIFARLKQFKHETARLEGIRKVQEESFQSLINERAALQALPAPPPHHYVPLEPFQREAEHLKALSEQFSSEQFQTPESTVQGSFGSLEQMFRLYNKIILGLREITAKNKEALPRLAQEVEALRNPLNQISPELLAVCRGDLSTLLDTRPVAAVPAASLLTTLLARFPNEAPAIYHLAIFIANANPELLRKGTPLYESLRAWMLNRAAQGENLIAKRDLLLVAIGRSPNAAPQDLLEPLEVVGNLDTLLRGISKDPVANTRRLIAKPDKNRAEKLFCRLIEHSLGQIECAPLEDTDPANFLDPLSLFDQLVSPPTFNAQMAGVRDIGATWQERCKAGEVLIGRCIHDCCDVRALQKAVLAARHEGEGRITTRLPEINMGLVEQLGALVAKGPIQEQDRSRYLDAIETEIYRTCKTLTNLTAQDPKKFVRDFCTLFETGKTPRAFQQLLAQGDGKYALYVARLVYYHQAISNMKKGFEGFASHDEWGWLVDDKIPPSEAARRMQILIQSFHEDENLAGSAMIPKQVRWASHLHDLMTRGTIYPIYSDAGSGKTVTAIFTMRLLQKVLPGICQNKDVHLLSPFYTRVVGLHCHQLIDPKGTFYIDVADDAHLQDVVLVDEAHILDPDIKIMLRSPTGRTLEVQPLPMTATPVIPNDAYEPFRKELHVSLQKEYAAYSREYAHLQKAFQGKRDALSLRAISEIEDRIRPKRQGYLAYTKHLPRAQRAYFEKHLKVLDEGNFSQEDIEQLLVTMNWFLSGCQVEGPLLTSHDYRGRMMNDPMWTGAVKPLQSLGTDASGNVTNRALFTAPQKVLLALQKDLRTIQALQRGSSVALPEDLQEEEQILEKMGKDLAELEGKLKKWRREDRLATVENGDEILRTLPAKRAEKFKGVQYGRRELQQFSGTAAADMVAAMPTPAQPVIQLIYPGARFTQDNFPDLVLKLQPVMSEKYPGKEISFIYQDSHSDDGRKGKKWAVKVQDEQLVFTPLTEYSPGFDPERQVAVLLYDTTNKQGGDFNGMSRVEGKFEIAQFLFYNFTDNMDVDPTVNTSANDLYQALSRRRGVSQIPSTVVGTFPAMINFSRAVHSRQWDLEKSWGARNAAGRIAKKLLKAYTQRHAPRESSTIRHHQPAFVQASVSRHIPGLANVHLIDELRKGLLTMPLEAASNPRELITRVDSADLKMLIHEATEIDAPQEDKKHAVVIPAADHAALWRIRKLQAEITYLTQATVRYQPAKVE